MGVESLGHKVGVNVCVLNPSQLFLTETKDSILVLTGTALFRKDIDDIIRDAKNCECPIIDSTRAGEVIIPSIRDLDANFARMGKDRKRGHKGPK